MTVNRLLKQFCDVVKDFKKSPSEWKKQHDGKVVGWLKTDVPEELIHAAGCLPFGIVGGKTDFNRVDAHLQTWACSLMRSSLAMMLNGHLKFLDGLIIPHTCDTTRMLAGIWKHVSPLSYMENFFLPRQVDRSSARTYLLAELKRLKENLESFSGNIITEEKLIESITVYNENRRLLRRLFTLHEQYPTLISNRDLYTIVRASMIMAKEVHNHWLKQLLNELIGQSQNQIDIIDTKIRVIISGPVWEPPEVMDIIEKRGVVVGDDLLTGYRYFANNVNEEDNPLEALADRQLSRIPFAGFDCARNPRRQFLVNLAREKKAHGVIFLHLKFCEPENYDYYDNKLALEKAGIPNIRIETEVGSSSLEQVRTRIEAFLEMVGGNLDGTETAI